MTYDTAVRILTNLSAMGNPVAATWLQALQSCPIEMRPEILRHIESFCMAFQYDARRVGPSEWK